MPLFLLSTETWVSDQNLIKSDTQVQKSIFSFMVVKTEAPLCEATHFFQVSKSIRTCDWLVSLLAPKLPFRMTAKTLDNVFWGGVLLWKLNSLFNNHEDQRALYGIKPKPFLKLREEWTLIKAIAPTLSEATTIIWNVLKKKQTTGVLRSKKHGTGRPRISTAVDDVSNASAVTKRPKPANLHRAAVTISQSTVRRRLTGRSFIVWRDHLHSKVKSYSTYM